MIWSLSFCLFFFFNLKAETFFGYLFLALSDSLIMMSVIPLNLGFFYFVSQNSSTSFEKKKSFILFLIVAIFLALCFLSQNSFMFLIFLEASILPMIILILIFSKDKDKISSVLFMSFINLFGSIPFMVFVYMNCLALGGSAVEVNSVLIQLMFIIVLVLKMPIFFFHFWLNKAHVSAAGCCSMVLASIMLKLGTFGLFKFSLPFITATCQTMNFMLALSCMSCLLLALLMIRFVDIKNLIAYSSVIHMSMILPLTLSFSSIGALASLMMMVSHGLVSFFLFYMVTKLYETHFNRSMDFNKSMESISKSFTLVMFFYLFLNLGLPPFMGFLSEVYTCYFLLKFSFSSLAVVSVSMTISIIFLMFLLVKSLFGKKMMISNFNTEMNLMSISFFYFFFIFSSIFLF